MGMGSQTGSGTGSRLNTGGGTGFGYGMNKGFPTKSGMPTGSGMNRGFGTGTSNPSINLMSSVRRRLMIEDGNAEDTMSNHDQKCKVLRGYELCVGHDFVDLRRLGEHRKNRWSPPSRMAMYDGEGEDDGIEYIASQQFVYDDERGDSQCFVYHDTMSFCMTMDAESKEMWVGLDEDEQLRFSVDADWEEIETVHDVVESADAAGADITSKCVWSGDAKICVQEMVNEEYEVLMYTANVHYLAVSVSREGVDDDTWLQLDEQIWGNDTSVSY